MRTSYISKSAFWLITLFLVLIAMRPIHSPPTLASADSSRFDHIYIVAPVFLYKGQQGLLLMDKRNGNVWFIGRGTDQMNPKYGDPVFVSQVPLEKVDQAHR